MDLTFKVVGVRHHIPAWPENMGSPPEWGLSPGPGTFAPSPLQSSLCVFFLKHQLASQNISLHISCSLVGDYKWEIERLSGAYRSPPLPDLVFPDKAPQEQA